MPPNKLPCSSAYLLIFGTWFLLLTHYSPGVGCSQENLSKPKNSPLSTWLQAKDRLIDYAVSRAKVTPIPRLKISHKK
jgi:hypothetical protein